MLPPCHAFRQVSEDSNLKWPIYCHFCFAQIDKILETFVHPDQYLPNKYLLVILNTCINYINYNPSMKPVKFHYNQIQNGRRIAIFVCSNCSNIWKLLSGWISATPLKVFLRYFTHTFPIITYNNIFYPVGIQLRKRFTGLNMMRDLLVIVTQVIITNLNNKHNFNYCLLVSEYRNNKQRGFCYLM